MGAISFTLAGARKCSLEVLATSMAFLMPYLRRNSPMECY